MSTQAEKTEVSLAKKLFYIAEGRDFCADTLKAAEVYCETPRELEAVKYKAACEDRYYHRARLKVLAVKIHALNALGYSQPLKPDTRYVIASEGYLGGSYVVKCKDMAQSEFVLSTVADAGRHKKTEVVYSEPANYEPISFSDFSVCALVGEWVEL